MTTTSFVQVPPQSTGKKVLTETRTQLHYDNQLGSITKNATITGQTSGATGIVRGITTEGFGPAEGVLYLEDVTGTFVDNESLEISGGVVADVTFFPHAPIEFDAQKVVLSDADNPEYTQRIDRFGATVNTFTDGSPVFGPFGTLTIGEPQVIKAYRFAMDLQEGLWYTETVGGGAMTYEADRTACNLSTGTSSGDLIRRTTHYRHPYIPGVGRNVEFTAQLGDSGKTNLRRRAGYFDDNDGVYFESVGSDIFLVVRSSVSGSVVETRVPQSDWNEDKADGTDSIGFNLDPTKASMFWIDMQWHGAGRVRFGTYEPLGSRVPLHTFQFANTSDVYPYTKTATLPLRFEQENIGVVASPSEMRFTSAVVRHSSEAIIVGTKSAYASPVKTISDTDGEVPIFSLRPSATFNGVVNTGTIKGLSVHCANLGNNGGGGGNGNGGNPHIILRLRFSPEGDVGLTGHNFQDYDTGVSHVQFDSTATALSGAPTSNDFITYIKPGDTYVVDQLKDQRQLHTYELGLLADQTTQPVGIVTAEVIGTGTTDVIANMNFEEFRW